MNGIWKIQIGHKVTSDGKIYEVKNFLDSKTLLARSLETGEFEKLRLVEIQPVLSETGTEKKLDNSSGSREEVDLGSVPDEKWTEAEQRATHVRKILALPHPTHAEIDKEALSLGVSRATMYRYIDKYIASEKASALIPVASSGGRGKKRTDKEPEAILETTINEFYLTNQKRSPAIVIREYERRCYNAGVKPVHGNTVRNRIDEICDIEKTKSREGKNAARRLHPAPGEFPEGDYPFQIVQIDHTPIDLQNVDDVTRLSIGRLWLTVMIDVFSRMILGFYLSPDAPSVNSIGLCMAHAVLPKEKELLRLGIDAEWNCWGLMNKIHADNGSDFRSAAFQRACREYDIDVEWRPVARPNFGAHIERLLGTFLREIHELPGTTFSNISAKGDYDSEKEAVMTYKDLEKWLTVLITKVYHKRKHDGIGVSPEVKFEQGLYIGSTEYGPTGPPPKIMDERKFRIDFMPTIERTIQPFGIENDLIQYYDSVLNPYIGAKDLKMPKYARKFIFKQNPRAIEKIYFYHPDLKRYFDIPYRNLANPPMTLWELKAVRKKLKADGIKVNSEAQIFEGLNKMREIEQSAITETKSARRKAQSKRIYEDEKKRHNLSENSASTSVPKDESYPAEPINPASNSVKSGGYSDFFNISGDEIEQLEVEDF